LNVRELESSLDLLKKTSNLIHDDPFPILAIEEEKEDELGLQCEEEEGEIALWQLGSRLTWTMHSDTFPTKELADYSREQFNLAIKDWGIKGIDFRYVSETDKDSHETTFGVKYCHDEHGGTVAKAFFPVEARSDVVVYPLAFNEKQKPFMRNNFSHEIGHIFGLRHEFAPKEHSQEEAFKYGPNNEESVMNYNEHHAPIIQETDRAWLQKLYEPTCPRVLATSRDSMPVKRIKPFGDKLKQMEALRASRQREQKLQTSRRDQLLKTDSKKEALRNSIKKEALRNSIRNNNNK